MKNILITGGAGFIGSNLALKLILKGYNVRILDNLLPQIHGKDPEKTSTLYQSIMGKVEFIKGTVTSKKDWQKALEGEDVIIHLAAETGTGQSMYEIERYCNVNIGGTAIMLDILANEKHSIKKIIIASSRAIYGEGKYKCDEHGIVYPNVRVDADIQAGNFNCKCPICNKPVLLLPTSEDSKIHPISIYGITKQNQEQMVLLMGQALNIPTVVFRYQNVYGPGQSLTNPYTGILSIFSALMLQNKTINIFEDGKESRDFVYIDDVVTATILGIENNKANNNIYNVGSGTPISIEEIARILLDKYRLKGTINITGKYRFGDIRHNYADITKINKELNYSPQVKFDIGIEKFCKWGKTQKLYENKYSKSITELKIKGLLK